ncbi:hypothetical protein BDP27DRAFT_1413559 [Rhodocollybia butyracea]|uniref:Uncharacterized protein n=1 Tax=Rhodocollybia butyracea TaxID=206335 RepID=A0A9P5UFB4_9AGAR|nr:hypothetical protein BDP27DRAFT_1413559 [Rhodocollybia butyracea]
MFFITALFIGTFLEVLVYGAYVATFIRHVRILVLRRRKLPPRTFICLSTATFLLFVAATVMVVTDFIFATHIFKNPTEPIVFSGYGRKHNINTECGLFSLMVSDAFLIYRSYILYNSRLRVVALPLLVFVVECGMGIWSIISTLTQKNDVNPWTEHPQEWTLAETIFICISVAMNVMCLIIACLWRSHRRLLAAGVPNLQSPPSAYAQVGAIIINSATINLVWWVSGIVTSTISSLMYEVFACVSACGTALIFSTIIVSASRLHSSESSALVSIPPLRFPQDSIPNSTLGLSADDMLEAGIQPELSSQEKSNNGSPPQEV